MNDFGNRLRERARKLNLSDAEVARRAGLNERRYGHYVTGTREPDLATFARICRVLETDPNTLLGFDQAEGADASGDRLKEQLASATRVISEADLALSVKFVEMLIDYRRTQE